MRCYIITAKSGEDTIATRIAGTNALARETRDQLMEKFGLRKKDIAIDGADVPTQKDALIEHINGLHEAADMYNPDDADPT